MEAYVKAMNKAKIQLMSRPDTAFYTTIFFSLKLAWDTEQRMTKTACTDGKTVWFNPDFFMSLNKEEQLFLIVHETLHVAYLHMCRKGTKSMRRWNHATDYVINLQLVERGYKMPVPGLLNKDFRGLSAEEVYDRIPEPPEDADTDLIEPEGDLKQNEEHIQDILIRAQVQSKMSGDAAGTIPGEVEIYLNKLLNPKLPWQSILRKYLNSTNKSDYSFHRPNRRFFPDHILPSLYGQGLGELAVAVDTSGSVSDAEFLRFISETAGIIRNMKPEKIQVVQFDTCLKSVDEATSLSELSHIKFTGRGGTCIEPVLEWAKTRKPKVLLVFTDGFFNWHHIPKQLPPTVWLIHNNPGFTAPFGKVIHYEVEA